MYDLGYVKNPEDAGKKLRTKIWNCDGLTEKMISPCKSNHDQRVAATPEKVAQFKGVFSFCFITTIDWALLD